MVGPQKDGGPNTLAGIHCGPELEAAVVPREGIVHVPRARGADAARDPVRIPARVVVRADPRLVGTTGGRRRAATLIEVTPAVVPPERVVPVELPTAVKGLPQVAVSACVVPAPAEGSALVEAVKEHDLVAVRQ